MQNELLAENSASTISILGINKIGSESGNSAICNGRDIPWLQDTVNDEVWLEWQVTYRDVLILDENNVPVAVYNLTQHDLNNPSNYAALKALLLDVAGQESTTTTTTTSSLTTSIVGFPTTTIEGLCPTEKLYGEHSEEAQLLRYLRDNVLSKTLEGREITRLYYQLSPVIIKAMEEDEDFKEDVKELLNGILPLIMGVVE